jgi:hypothetical protein
LFVFRVWVMLLQQQRIIKNFPQDAPSFLHTLDDPVIWDSRTSKAKQSKIATAAPFSNYNNILFSLSHVMIPQVLQFFEHTIPMISATISEAFLFLAALPENKGGKKKTELQSIYLSIYLTPSLSFLLFFQSCLHYHGPMHTYERKPKKKKLQLIQQHADVDKISHSFSCMQTHKWNW